MKTTCEHCETLDLISMMGGSSETISKTISEKLIRYYCRNDKTENIYCPNSGQRENCRYYKDF